MQPFRPQQPRNGCKQVIQRHGNRAHGQETFRRVWERLVFIAPAQQVRADQAFFGLRVPPHVQIEDPAFPCKRGSDNGPRDGMGRKVPPVALIFRITRRSIRVPSIAGFRRSRGHVRVGDACVMQCRQDDSRCGVVEFIEARVPAVFPAFP